MTAFVGYKQVYLIQHSV